MITNRHRLRKLDRPFIVLESRGGLAGGLFWTRQGRNALVRVLERHSRARARSVVVEAVLSDELPAQLDPDLVEFLVLLDEHPRARAVAEIGSHRVVELNQGVRLQVVSMPRVPNS